jgi:outer membrane protein, heavy metal efflux system
MLPARPLAVLVLVAALATPVLAQSAPAPLDLDAAWSRAPEVSADVATRRIDLDIASRTAARAELDPLATGLERLQAEQGLAAAVAALASAERSARIAALQAYVAVIQAIDAEAQAVVRADLGQRNLAAARVRHEAGAITDLALSQAAADADSAERAARDAATDLAFAWSDLAAVVGIPADELRATGLAPVPPALPELPDLERGLASLASAHTGIAAAERALALAELRLRGVDHEGSSPNAVADARADVATAQRRVEDAVRNAEQQLRAAHQNLLVAYGRLDDARTADASAVTTLEAQRVRQEAGELSPIAWLQAQLDRERAAASLRASVHAAWLQWLRYEQALAGN